MKLTTDEERYEALMIDYQIVELARLNEVLRRHGISDASLRQRICAEFMDSSGSFLDQGWLASAGTSERYWPELVFSRRELDPAEGLGEAEELIVPEYASNFHDYVQGALEYYFDEHGETLGPIQTGSA